jgi:hypothetical protein
MTSNNMSVIYNDEGKGKPTTLPSLSSFAVTSEARGGYIAEGKHDARRVKSASLEIFISAKSFALILPV